MSRLQAIVDAIWAHPTRTLRAGVPIEEPANRLEAICMAAWAHGTRALTTSTPGRVRIAATPRYGLVARARPRYDLEIGAR